MGTNIADDALMASIEKIFDFETKLAKVSFINTYEFIFQTIILNLCQISTPEDERRNATELYNPTTLGKLKETYKVSQYVHVDA